MSMSNNNRDKIPARPAGGSNGVNKLLVLCLAFLLIPLGTELIIGQENLADEAEEPTPTPPPRTTEGAGLGSREPNGVRRPVTAAPALEKEIADYISQLLDDNPIVVDRARNELLELGHRAVPQLIRALAHEKPVLRYLACEILAELRDARALDALLRLLEDKEEAGMSIGAITARALGRLGDAAAISPLTRALLSTDVDLRYEALHALGTLRAYEALPEISKLISDTARTFFDYEIRCGAIKSLGRLKARTEMQELIDLLTIKANEPATERPVVEYVIVALECITGETQGPIPLEDGPKRDELIKKWQDWWAEHKDEYGAPKEPEKKPAEPTEEPKEPEKKPEEPSDKPKESEEKPAAEGEPRPRREESKPPSTEEPTETPKIPEEPEKEKE